MCVRKGECIMWPNICFRLWFLGIVCTSFVVATCVGTGNELSEGAILAVLPKGSVIAKLPTSFAEDGRTLAHKKAIIPVRLMPGVDGQAVVGYYTEPDPKGGRPMGPRFHSRCHVALVAETGTEPQVIWDSGGWGSEFGMERIDETRYSDDQLALFLGIRDLNGDGKSELVFSRASFRAEGTRFEIWEYHAEEKKMVRVCLVDGWIKLIEGTGKDWPRIECRSFHASTMSSAVFEYDSDLQRYKHTEP